MLGRRKWVLFGSLLGVLLLGSVMIGWLGLRAFMGSDPLSGGPQDELTNAQIESAAYMRLPPSAHNVQVLYDGFQEYHIHVRFEMDPADLPAFLSSTQITSPLSTTLQPFNHNSLEPQRAWWTPQQAQHWQAAMLQRDLFSQAVLIDMTDPQRYIVFVGLYNLG